MILQLMIVYGIHGESIGNSYTNSIELYFSNENVIEKQMRILESLAAYHNSIEAFTSKTGKVDSSKIFIRNTTRLN